MQMPNMDGLQLATAIRERYPNLPMILLSSIGNDTRKQYEHLFSHILTKPVKQKTLSHAINIELRKLSKSSVSESAKETKLSEDFARRYPLRILIAEDSPVNQLLATR